MSVVCLSSLRSNYDETRKLFEQSGSIANDNSSLQNRIISGCWICMMLRIYKSPLIGSCISGGVVECSRCMATTSYSHTLNLPKSSFTRVLKAAARKQLDERMCARSQELYDWQLNCTQRQHLPVFTLLDGPPYANGSAHVGHAVNRILKDFIVRHRILTGHRVRYRPGWDCHGLPIENKVTRLNLTSQNNGDEPDAIQIRGAARQIALSSIDLQRGAFRQWATVADWDNPYTTDDNAYQAKQLSLLYTMYKHGLMERANRPVYWSPSSRTALAEAELEYKHDHVSTAVLCRFELTNLDVSKLCPILGDRVSMERGQVLRTYALVWTTTPWTLPLNNAICYHPNVNYVCVSNQLNPHSVHDVYVMAEPVWLNNRVDIFGAEQVNEWHQLGDSVPGRQLFGRHTRYVNLMWHSFQQPFIPADHVKSNVGTGLVHSAYAHGFDDFKVAEANEDTSMIECFVDEKGNYTRHLGPHLYSLNVVNGEANNAVLDMFRKHIIRSYDYTHSYPYDWRTKQPVIIRSSPQWFIDVDKVKEKALSMIDGIQFRSPGDNQYLVSSVSSRPSWCISRQRCWGVPLPILYRSDNQQPVISDHLVRHYQSLVADHGTDIWWSADDETLAPRKLLSDAGVPDGVSVKRETDVLDVWFDSGVAWSCSETNDVKADLVIEGQDQFRGWFQSLLWTAALSDRESSPYKRLLAHGFVVDEQGQKMSKSLGNVIDPIHVIEGTPQTDKPKQKKSKNKSGDQIIAEPEPPKLPAIGVDGLRFWVASYGGSPDSGSIQIGANILGDVQQRMSQVRNTLKFVLGVLNGFESVEDVSGLELDSLVDRHMAAALGQHVTRVDDAYHRYDFAFVLNESVKFLLGDFGSRYVAAVKDRLYCDPAGSQSRQQALAVCDMTVRTVLGQLSPILPVLADEYLQHRGSHDHVSSLSRPWPTIESLPKLDSHAAHVVNSALPIVKRFLALHANESDRINVHLECRDASTYRQLCDLARPSSPNVCDQISDLSNLLRCSSVTVSLSSSDNHNTTDSQTIDVTDNIIMTVNPTSHSKCDRCRRYLVKSPVSESLCHRCDQTIKAQGHREAKLA